MKNPYLLLTFTTNMYSGCGGLAPGEVFARTFNMALSLGCLSPRRVMVARQRGALLHNIHLLHSHVSI